MMKKLLIILSLFGVSVAIGLLLFHNIAPTSKNSTSYQPQKFQDQVQKKKTVPRKTSAKFEKLKVIAEGNKGSILDHYYKNLNNYINDEAIKDDLLCKNKFKEFSVDKDYLDPNSAFFKDGSGIDQFMTFISQLSNISTKGIIVDHSIEQIMLTDHWNPLEIKQKMSQSVVCMDVDYTNLTHAFINTLKNKNITQEHKNQSIKYLLFMSQVFSESRDPIEYQFYSMEILFGLLDNNLIPSTYSEDLVNLRQQIVRTVQNFESDFNERNDKRTNQDLLRGYRDSTNDISFQINDIAESISNEIPQ